MSRFVKNYALSTPVKTLENAHLPQVYITGVPEIMATFCFVMISLIFRASNLIFFSKEPQFNSLQSHIFLFSRSVFSKFLDYEK